MSRSFYVDSLIVKDAAARPVPSLPEPPPPPPPGQDFLIPLGVPAPLVMSVAGGPACPSRKSGGGGGGGSFCVCPLCVTSHLHASARAGGGGGGGAVSAASLPLLKGHFAPSGEGQFCPRMSHGQQQQPAPQQQQQPPPGSVAAAAAQALAHPPVCAAAAYGMSDPRRFHCLGLGRSCPGLWEGGRVEDLRWGPGSRALMPSPALRWPSPLNLPGIPSS